MGASMGVTIEDYRETADEFLGNYIAPVAWMESPLGPPDTVWELAHGLPEILPRPGKAHRHATARLTELLDQHVGRNDLGLVLSDAYVRLGDEDVRRPDLVYFTKDRLDVVDARCTKAPPDLCVELPTLLNAEYDRVDKFTLYERCAVSTYWIVDPYRRTFEAYELVEGKYALAARGANGDTVAAAPFDDLAIPLTDLWLSDDTK
jgi:Uma2 family endonuclease